MRPRFRVDAAGGALLDPVVADGGRGVEAVGDVSSGQVFYEPSVHGVSGPDACVAVCLKLEPH